MKLDRVMLLAGLVMLLVTNGCESTRQPTDPNAVDWYDRSLGKREDCWGYRVIVEASDPGSRIEVNDEHVTTLIGTTGEIILWGYKDGRFREEQVVRIVANPVKLGQNQQTKIFQTVRGQRPQIPHRLYFNLNLERTMPTDKKDIKIHRD